MKSYDIIGYTTADGEILCPGRAEKRAENMRNAYNEYGELGGDGYFGPYFVEYAYQDEYCDTCGYQIWEE